MLHILALISGILLVSTFSSLPAFPGWLALLPLSLLFLPNFFPRRIVSQRVVKILRTLGCFLLGIGWGLYAGHQLLDGQLASELEAEEIVIRGDIVDLPEQRAINQRFLFRIDEAHRYDKQHSDPLQQQSIKAPRRVLITQYRSGGDSAQPLLVGQRWQFVVKLKRPRALVNEGGFDYHRWLLSQNIGATGYIRQSPLNGRLPPAKAYPVQQFRSQVRQWLLAVTDEQSRGPLLALAIGDNSLITPAQWRLFRATGTSHLMAISGLHIGLLAVFGFFLGRAFCTALAVFDRQWLWLRFIPGLCSSGFALGYSALAGFGLPTQRALIMVLLLNLALLFHRGHWPLRALALAALIVLFVDPLAGWDMGFWLSFGAVAVLLGYFQFRRHSKFSNSTSKILNSGVVIKVVTFVRAQGVVFIGLMLPLLIFNTPLSLLAPIANFIVIPVVSLLVVIPLLAAVVLQAVFAPLANLLINVASIVLQWCVAWLDFLQNVSSHQQWFPDAGISYWPLILLAGLGLVLLLQGRGFPGRWLGGLLVLPALFPLSIQQPPLTVTVLDVGQGLAVVAQTPDHTLVYDTGALFSDSFNIGEAVVLPYLRQQGVHQVDTLIVSHADNDHAGGAQVILDTLPVNRLVVGETIFGNQQSPNQELCESDQYWIWQGVTFQLIEPQLTVGVRDNNNLSCVLLISYGDQHILLPGDIESSVERALISHRQLPSPLPIIVAPHHGSRTSSTTAWVDYLQPERVVFSAGFGSRYGHPHPQVTHRYQQSGATLYNTADLGQIKLVWSASGDVSIHPLRQEKPRYWY